MAWGGTKTWVSTDRPADLAAELNRIEGNCEFLAGLLSGNIETQTHKLDWAMTDYPTIPDIERIDTNVKMFADYYGYSYTIRNYSDIIRFDYRMLNGWELVLQETHTTYYTEETNPTHEYDVLDHIDSALVGYVASSIWLTFDVPISGSIHQADHFTVTGILAEEFNVNETWMYFPDGEADEYYGMNKSDDVLLEGLFEVHLGETFYAQYIHYDGLGDLRNAVNGLYIPEFTIEVVVSG